MLIFQIYLGKSLVP